MTATRASASATAAFQMVVKTRPTTLDDCKDDVWPLSSDPSFAKQGQCVSFVAAGKG